VSWQGLWWDLGENGQKLQPSVKSGTGIIAVGHHQKGHSAVKHEAPEFYLCFLSEIRGEPGVITVKIGQKEAESVQMGFCILHCWTFRVC